MPRAAQNEERQTNEQRRLEYLAKLDSAPQAVVAGGVNGAAGIPGVPGRSEASTSGQQLMAKGVVYAEPVAVVLRDAVTVETAERLLGCDRRELRRSITRGYLPAMKLGPATAPYLVRLRDVAWWLMMKYASSRSKRQFLAEHRRGDPNTGYVGFPDWLIARVKELHPEAVGQGREGTAVADPAQVRRLVNRGGRPPKEKPPGEELPAAENPEVEKTRTGGPNHAPELPPLAEPMLSKAERQKLPKWHPLWLRPDPTDDAPQAAPRRRPRPSLYG